MTLRRTLWFRGPHGLEAHNVRKLQDLSRDRALVTFVGSETGATMIVPRKMLTGPDAPDRLDI